MKTLKLFLFLSIILVASNCKRTCENVKVGELELSELASSFFNYAQGELISFKSKQANSIGFTVDIQEEKYFICQNITCDPLDPYKSSYCEYLESPQKTLLLLSDSTLISLTVALQNYEPESDLIYEYVKFTLSHKNDFAVASFISEVRFEEPEFDRNSITDIDAFVEERSSISLNDETFSDVLVCEDEKLSLIYQKGRGFVGFSINGEVYTIE